MSPTFPWNRHPRGELSAYVDGELSASAASRIDAHAAGCNACRAEVAALRETKATLRALTEVAAPRSFALTPEQAQRPAIAPQPYPRSAQPAAFGLRIASAGLAVALAAVVFVDVSDRNSSDSGDDLRNTAAELSSAQGAEDQSIAGAGTDGGALQAGTPDDKGTDAPRVPGGDDDIGATPLASPVEDSVGFGVAAPTPTSTAQPLPPDAVATPGYLAAPETAESLSMASGELADRDEDAHLPATGAITESSGGSDTLRIAEIMLGVGLVLALAASVVVSRLGRRVA